MGLAPRGKDGGSAAPSPGRAAESCRLLATTLIIVVCCLSDIAVQGSRSCAARTLALRSFITACSAQPPPPSAASHRQPMCWQRWTSKLTRSC